MAKIVLCYEHKMTQEVNGHSDLWAQASQCPPTTTGGWTLWWGIRCSHMISLVSFLSLLFNFNSNESMHII